MKVAWIIRPAAGGILQHLGHLLNGLDSKFQIIICGPEALADWVKDRPFYPIKLIDGIDPLQDLKGIWQFSRILKRERPELIHVHGLKSVMIAVPAAKMHGIHNIMFTAHNCLPKPDSRWYKMTNGLIYRGLMRSLRRVITVSNAARNELVEYIPSHRIVTIYNGVDYQRFSGFSRHDSRISLEFSGDDLVVGVVARLIMEKGIASLLKAASLLKPIQPNIKFVIVGDGPHRRNFESYSRALNLESSVIFTGYRSDIPYLMAGWDLFVLPSLSEGFSVSVLEAMAAKLPVIVSDLPSMREMVVQGKGGYLVSSDDAPALAAAILGVLKDIDKARIMGEYNYNHVICNFGIEKMVRRTEEQYNQLIREDS